MQVVGDLVVGPTLSDRDQDLLFPDGERSDGLRGFWLIAYMVIKGVRTPASGLAAASVASGAAGDRNDSPGWATRRS